MYQRLLSLLFFILCLTKIDAQQWGLQYSLPSQVINCVFFLNKNIGWSVGGVGFLLKTTNGGQNWTAQNSGTPNFTNSIYFTDSLVGWIVGSGGTIMKTTNGGQNWTAQNSGTTNNLHSVYFTDSQTGWAVGIGGTIIKTTNGGQNWTGQYSGTANWLQSVRFTDSQTGWAVGTYGTIIKTTNGGQTWTTQNSGTGNYLYSVHFTDSHTGWVVGESKIIKTINGGQTWTIQNSGTTNFLTSVNFTDSQTGWAVGIGGTIIKTTNGGQNWIAQNSGTTNDLWSVCFPDNNNGWAVGSKGTILKYIDTNCSHPDYKALLALYNSTGGPNWTNNTGWKDGAAGTNCDPCNGWFGVKCADGRVNYLDLGSNKLKGSIPKEFGNLDSLQYLRLFNNQLNGSLPKEIGNFNNLHSLLLPNNKLTGSIPKEIGNLTNLERLTLSENQLIGSIPKEFGNLTNLIQLYLDNNQITGIIPPDIKKLNNLNLLDLTKNQLTGSIPNEIGSLTNMIWLYLKDNQLTGSIPTEIGNLTNLVHLDLSNNQLTGSIPQEIGNLSKLGQIILPSNNLNGCFDPNLLKLCNVQIKDFSNNPLLPWQGDFSRFCAGESQTGAVCNDGNASTTNDVIQGNCECVGKFDEVNFCVDSSVIFSGADYSPRMSNAVVFNDTVYIAWTNGTYYKANPAYSKFDGIVYLSSSVDGKTWKTVELFGTTLGTQGHKLAVDKNGKLHLVYNEGTQGDYWGLIKSKLVYASNTSGSWQIVSPDLGNGNGKIYNHTTAVMLKFGPDEKLRMYYGNNGWWPLGMPLYMRIFDNNAWSQPVPVSIKSDGANDSQNNVLCQYKIVNGKIRLYISDGWHVACAGCVVTFYNKIRVFEENASMQYVQIDSMTNLRWYQEDSKGNTLKVLSDGKTVLLNDTPFFVCPGDEIIYDRAYFSFDEKNILIYTNTKTSGFVRIFDLDKNEIYSSLSKEILSVPGYYIIANNHKNPRSIFACFPECKSEHPDFDPLMSLYNSTDGPNWTNNTGWKEGAQGISCDPCKGWYGVKCENGRVTHLDMDGKEDFALNASSYNGNKLNGTLPMELGDLTKLKVFDLDVNNIYGEFPASIFSLDDLTHISLNYCKMSGNLSSGLSQLTNLKEINLRYNSFSGSIPESFGALSMLERLDLWGNNLSGNIPDIIGNLTNLNYLFLNFNNFTGEIPVSLGNLNKLYVLWLSGNKLEGKIPVTFANLTNLYWLFLDSNKLSGELPDFFSLLPNLTTLHLQNNNFSGCIATNYSKWCNYTNCYDSHKPCFNISNNPLLPWKGDFSRFCAGELRTGAVCDDGNTDTENDRIRNDCICRGDRQLKNILTITEPVSCHNGTDGIITLSFTGDPSYFLFSWYKDGSQFQEGIGLKSVSGLEGAIYKVIITELNNTENIQTLDNIIIDEPQPLNISGDITDKTCSGAGSIILTVKGGTGPYTYVWSNPSIGNTSIANGLDQGVYKVTITDSKNCPSEIRTYTINSTITALSASGQFKDLVCNNSNDGEITLSITGGCTPYKIKWSDSQAPDNPKRTSLAAGNYKATITDASGQIQEMTYTLTNPPLLEVTANVVEEQTGSIIVTVAGGESPYTFSWSGPNGFSSTQKDITNLTKGIYNLKITDKRGCAVTKSYEITGIIQNIKLNAIVNNDLYNGYGVRCFGECNGILTATVHANQPFKIFLDDKEITLPYDKLCEGSHNIKIVDAYNKIKDTTIYVTQPEELQVSLEKVECDDLENTTGSINLGISGGIQPYYINWGTGFGNNELIENLKADSYLVIITDENNCRFITEEIEVPVCNRIFGSIILTDIITPNGDKVNDELRFNAEDKIEGFELNIYNRWGSRIYHKKDYDNSWDAKGFPGGIYFYIVEYQGFVFKRTLTVAK